MGAGEEHTVDGGILAFGVGNYKLFTIKVLFHYQSALCQLAKKHIVRTFVNGVIGESATFVPETYAFATTHEVAKYSSIRVGAYV